MIEAFSKSNLSPAVINVGLSSNISNLIYIAKCNGLALFVIGA